MSNYELPRPGAQVQLVYANDPATLAEPGDIGTVIRVNEYPWVEVVCEFHGTELYLAPEHGDRFIVLAPHEPKGP